VSRMNKPAPLTRKTLDKLTCQSPGCTHESHEGLVLHSACHTKAPTTMRYWANGAVEIRCKQCDRWIVEIMLHPEEQAAASEALACDDPHCEEPPENHSLVLRAPCHRDDGVFVTYQDGHLVVTCGECGDLVGSRHVAGGGPVA
jgi:ribosomal protein S27E